MLLMVLGLRRMQAYRERLDYRLLNFARMTADSSDNYVPEPFAILWGAERTKNVSSCMPLQACPMRFQLHTHVSRVPKKCPIERRVSMIHSSGE